MAENKIYPWAQTPDANALSDADYASAMATNGAYANGVKSGQASSRQANKTWRQGTSVAAGLAQFLVDNLSVDVTDANVPATFSSRITNAIIMLGQISNFNQSFATAIGGYKKYAIVSDGSGNYWSSTADQNTTVPGASGSKWQNLFSGYATQSWSSSQFVGRGASVYDFTPLQLGVNKTSKQIWTSYTDDSGNTKYAFAQVAGDYSAFATGWGANGYIEIPTAQGWKLVQQWVQFQGVTGTGGNVGGAYETEDIFVRWPLGMGNLLNIVGLSVKDVGDVGMNEKVWYMDNATSTGGSFRLACNKAGVTMTGSALIIGSISV